MYKTCAVRLKLSLSRNILQNRSNYFTTSNDSRRTLNTHCLGKYRSMMARMLQNDQVFYFVFSITLFSVWASEDSTSIGRKLWYCQYFFHYKYGPALVRLRLECIPKNRGSIKSLQEWSEHSFTLSTTVLSVSSFTKPVNRSSTRWHR